MSTYHVVVHCHPEGQPDAFDYYHREPVATIAFQREVRAVQAAGPGHATCYFHFTSDLPEHQIKSEIAEDLEALVKSAPHKYPSGAVIQ